MKDQNDYMKDIGIKALRKVQEKFNKSQLFILDKEETMGHEFWNAGRTGTWFDSKRRPTFLKVTGN